MVEKSDLPARLRELIGEQGERAFARQADVKPSTLRSVLAGTRPSIDFALSVSEACNVSLDWLVGRQGALRQAGSELNVAYLTEAINIVEEWLAVEDRTMMPKKKADVVTQIYQFIVEDAIEGQVPLDRNRARRILRLVA